MEAIGITLLQCLKGIVRRSEKNLEFAGAFLDGFVYGTGILVTCEFFFFFLSFHKIRSSM